MLSSLIALQHSTPSTPSPEDIFSASLSSLFPDDLQNIHGNSDPDTKIIYSSSRFGDLEFRTSDPEGEDERRKFAHYLWNAEVLMGELVGGKGKKWNRAWLGEMGEEWWWVDGQVEAKWKVDSETVLELGAGVGLAGIVSALAGAKEVTISDFPAAPLLATLKTNVEKNIPPSLCANVSVQPHEWGCLDTPFAISHPSHYTRILAADTLWLPHEHLNLARSMSYFLSPAPDACVFVIAGFHTGRANVAMFFEMIGEVGLEVEEIWEMDANGERREWRVQREGDELGERKRWLVVTRLRRIVEWKD